MFILNKSTGFAQVGVERLNESISPYVWVILQSHTCRDILKVGTGLDAQKQFQVNIEAANAMLVDIHSES